MTTTALEILGAFRRDLEQASQREAQLTAALLKWGRHTDQCNMENTKIHTPRCNCGWLDVLKLLESWGDKT